eukprot:SAG22_NODE_19_length_32182_cov_39.206963_12_plen_275_part_00
MPLCPATVCLTVWTDGLDCRHSTFQDAENIYIVLEYCHGGDLFGLMGMFDDEKLPVEYSRYYSASIASVFQHLHAKNIIYRDLKTENLLLDRAGYLKVADFGFAKKLANHPEHGFRTWTLCGTPEHLAPEIIQNKGHNQAADWWTLGINLYEFLAGMPPFNDETPIGTYRLIIAGLYKFPADMDKDGQDLITRLLDPDPSTRLTSLTNGGKDVTEHPFFAPLDFQALKALKLPPPFVPEVEDDEDISNFEEPEEPEDDIDTADLTINPADFEGW